MLAHQAQSEKVNLLSIGVGDRVELVDNVIVRFEYAELHQLAIGETTKWMEVKRLRALADSPRGYLRPLNFDQVLELLDEEV
jgi:hypothetical protein